MGRHPRTQAIMGVPAVLVLLMEREEEVGTRSTTLGTRGTTQGNRGTTQGNRGTTQGTKGTTQVTRGRGRYKRGPYWSYGWRQQQPGGGRASCRHSRVGGRWDLPGQGVWRDEDPPGTRTLHPCQGLSDLHITCPLTGFQHYPYTFHHATFSRHLPLPSSLCPSFGCAKTTAVQSWGYNTVSVYRC